MALHGEIKVNGSIIGEWSATRRTKHVHEINTYDVGVTYRNLDGRVQTATTILNHNFGDGALVLASEVLAWAGRAIYPGLTTTTTKESHRG